MFFMLAHFCAQGQVKPKWVDDLKGNSGNGFATCIAVDNQNNVYVTGYFYGTIDADPSPGVKNLTSEGLSDIFVGKYKQDGTLIWAESMGGTAAELPYGLAVDKDGNVSLVGSFYSPTFDADPGTGVYNLTSGGANASNGFIIHLNTNGAFLWANSVTNTGGLGQGAQVSTDSRDNIIATYRCSETVSISGDTTFQAEGNDGLIIKYNQAGTVSWFIHLSGNSSKGTASALSVGLYGIKIDNQDNIVVAGGADSTVNLNPLGTVYDVNFGGYAASSFVAKYSPMGILSWVSGIYSDFITGGLCTVTVDRLNNVYYSTAYSGTLSVGSFNLNSTGDDENICIAKYSPQGVLQFAKSTGAAQGQGFGGGISMTNALTCDTNNNLYLAGFFKNTINLSTDTESAKNITTHGQQDFYIAKYDPLGNYIYAFNGGSANCADTYGYSVAIDAKNNIDVAGSFCSNVNFDPSGCSPLSLTAAADPDPFFAQYAPETPITNNVITAPTISSFCTSGTPAALTGSLPTGGNGTFTYQWQSSVDSVNFVNINQATRQNYMPPTITATTYYQRMVNSGGCPSPPPALSSNVIKLTILPTLTAPVVTLAGTPSSNIIFTWTSVAGATGYQVSTDGGLTYSAHSGLTDTISNLQPGQSVTLIVQATGSIACQTSAASAPVTGMVPAGDLVYVANAFTPNADGRNDILHVLGANIQTLKFYIYDQWGEQIFSSTNQQNGWDGTYKGSKEPVGVYVYYLEAVMNDGQNVKKKGTITLLK